MITLLNTSILTSFGSYEYKPISLDEAKNIVAPPCPSCQMGCPVCSGTGRMMWGYQSAIGHQATAEILSELLSVPVEVNRINYSQEVDEQAIVFKLRGRAPEGSILSREEIEAIGYDFGLLERFS